MDLSRKLRCKHMHAPVCIIMVISVVCLVKTFISNEKKVYNVNVARIARKRAKKRRNKKFGKCI